MDQKGRGKKVFLVEISVGDEERNIEEVDILACRFNGVRWSDGISGGFRNLEYGFKSREDAAAFVDRADERGFGRRVIRESEYWHVADLVKRSSQALLARSVEELKQIRERMFRPGCPLGAGQVVGIVEKIDSLIGEIRQEAGETVGRKGNRS